MPNKCSNDIEDTSYKGRNMNFRGKNWHMVGGKGPVVSGDRRGKERMFFTWIRERR